eukprot:1950511-Pyramimonas_sp.AAC.1
MASFALGSLRVKSLLRRRSPLGTLVFRDCYVAALSWVPWCDELCTSPRSREPWCQELVPSPLADGSHVLERLWGLVGVFFGSFLEPLGSPFGATLRRPFGPSRGVLEAFGRLGAL